MALHDGSLSCVLAEIHWRLTSNFLRHLSLSSCMQGYFLAQAKIKLGQKIRRALYGIISPLSTKQITMFSRTEFKKKKKIFV